MGGVAAEGGDDLAGGVIADIGHQARVRGELELDDARDHDPEQERDHQDHPDAAAIDPRADRTVHSFAPRARSRGWSWGKCVLYRLRSGAVGARVSASPATPPGATLAARGARVGEEKRVGREMQGDGNGQHGKKGWGGVG